MKTPQVLLIEHDAGIAVRITERLTRSNSFAVEVVARGADGLRALSSNMPDALLVDTLLPDIPASELCRAIRARRRSANLPLILLSDRTALDPVIGLELGADDYVAKPLNPSEVEARLKAVLRRRTPNLPEPRPDRFTRGGLDADFGEIAVTVNGRPITLTRREFAFLRVLVQTCNQVVDRRTLLGRAASGPRRPALRSVDSVISRLRAKLQEVGEHIETVNGFGYRFNDAGLVKE
jgi:DNA-binding response OmpR family regulator